MKTLTSLRPYVLTSLILLVLNIKSFSQTGVFNFTVAPTNPTFAQQAIISSASAIPIIGTLQFVQFSTLSSLSSTSSLNISIPSVQNGAILTFEVEDVLFADDYRYSIYANSPNGTLALYVTPEGIGGVIDIDSRKFSLFPLGGEYAILFENDLAVSDGGICATDSVNTDLNQFEDYCEGDCGGGVLDVLVLRTDDVNQWLYIQWNYFAEWFLFVESNNINGAFLNSKILNKSVRVSFANFIPDFIFSSPANPVTDLNLVANSQEAQKLKAKHRADIVVLLTNRNYANIAGIAFFGPNTDPNNYCIAEVKFIDPSRYTMAHEIAHQFGCDHSLPNPFTCPHGMNLFNGRNTIMAFASNNSRIQNYSNPSVNFAGYPTGLSGIRDNASQIRAAFCLSVSNNSVPTYSTSFTPNNSICLGEPAYFESNVIQGKCPVPPLGTLGDCGLPPYIYEWRLSYSADFTNSTVVGMNTDLLLLNPPCSIFYIRLTVTSSDGLTTSSTKRIKCISGPCPRNSSIVKCSQNSINLIPNPVQTKASIPYDPINNPIYSIQCFSVEGRMINVHFDKFYNYIELDFSNLTSNVYYLIVQYEHEIKTIRVKVD